MTCPRSYDQSVLKPGFRPTSELLTKSLRPARARRDHLWRSCLGPSSSVYHWPLLPEGRPLRMSPKRPWTTGTACFLLGVAFLPTLLLHWGSHWGNPSSGQWIFFLGSCFQIRPILKNTSSRPRNYWLFLSLGFSTHFWKAWMYDSLFLLSHRISLRWSTISMPHRYSAFLLKI